jgi:hypothetical protein
MFKFKRPESLVVPQIYHTFRAKDNNSEKMIEYRVQDLLERDSDEAVKLMAEFFLPDEPFSIAFKISESAEAVNDFRKFWRSILEQKFSLACYKCDGSDELVAVNLLTVDSKNDTVLNPSEHKTKEFLDLMLAVKLAADQFNAFEAYKVDHYLSGSGLCTNPSFRDRGIATEVLKARIPMMKALGLKVTSTIYSTVGSQTAADRAGYKESFVISFRDIEKEFPNIEFFKTTKYYKTMDLEI